MPVLPTGMVCSCACVGCWSCREGLATDGGCSGACWLVGTVPEQWSSTRGGGRAQLLGARLGRGEAQDVLWVLFSIWTSGQSKLGGKSLTCFSNWYGLCLCLCNLLGLWGRAGLGEDVQVCRAGQQSGS